MTELVVPSHAPPMCARCESQTSTKATAPDALYGQHWCRRRLCPAHTATSWDNTLTRYTRATATVMVADTIRLVGTEAGRCATVALLSTVATAHRPLRARESTQLQQQSTQSGDATDWRGRGFRPQSPTACALRQHQMAQPGEKTQSSKWRATIKQTAIWMVYTQHTT